MMYSFGCSFSTKQWLTTEKFWVDILAKKLGLEYEAWGAGGADHLETSHRLSGVMKDFKEGDLVIYQFTQHCRVGFYHNNYYITSAGIDNYGETKKNVRFLQNYMEIDRTDEDYLTLLKFVNRWAPDQMFYHYWRVWNTLSFLQERVGIKIVLLFLDQQWTKIIPKKHYKYIPMFPITNENRPYEYDYKSEENIGIQSFSWENGIAMGQEDWHTDSNWHPFDGHPGEQGHQRIAEIVYEHIIKNEN